MTKQPQTTLHESASRRVSPTRQFRALSTTIPTFSPKRATACAARLPAWAIARIARQEPRRQAFEHAGLLTIGLNNYGPAQMVHNIERASKELGYDLIFSNVNE